MMRRLVRLLILPVTIVVLLALLLLVAGSAAAGGPAAASPVRPSVALDTVERHPAFRWSEVRPPSARTDAPASGRWTPAEVGPPVDR